MKNSIDSKLKKELTKIYDRAKVKENGTLYSSLKEELEISLESDSDGSKLESYKMFCENASSLDFNTNVTAIVISIGALVIDFDTSFPLTYSVAILTVIAIVAVVVAALFVHWHDQKYKYLLYVLNSITPKKPSSNYLVP